MPQDTPQIASPQPSEVPQSQSRPVDVTVPCDWCDNQGCDECEADRQAAVAAAQTASPANIPPIHIDCDWCDGHGCDECEADRQAALAAATTSQVVSPQSNANTNTNTNTNIAQTPNATPPRVQVDCEWCDGAGCDECAAEREAAADRARNYTIITDKRVQSDKDDAVWDNVNLEAQAMMDLYNNDDDEYGMYRQQDETISTEARVSDIFDTAQYLSPEFQLPHFEQLENIVQNDLFSFESCTGQQLSAYVHGITRLVIVRMLLKQDVRKIIETFHLVIKVHKKTHFFELLTATVSHILSLCSQYDTEESNNPPGGLNHWSNEFINVLNGYRETFPLLFVPVLRDKVHKLAADYDKSCGTFSSTAAQLAQWEANMVSTINDADVLLGLCTQSRKEAVALEDTMGNDNFDGNDG